MSVLNFSLARRAEKKRDKLRHRDDRREVERLLWAAWPKLWGPGSFSMTRDQATLDEADGYITEAARLEPDYPRVLEYQGHLLEVQGNKPAARKLYEKSIALDSTRGRAYICLAQVLENEDKLRLLGRAIQCDPDDVKVAATAYYLIGLHYRLLGQYQVAYNYINQALVLRPAYSEALVLMGRVLANLGRRDEAIDSYEKAVSSSPTCIDAMVNLGALISDTDWASGLAWIEHAMRIDPKNDYPYAMLAAVYADRKQPKEALQFYERAVELNPQRRTRADSTQEIVREMTKLLETGGEKPQ
jgi:tetratricopeptide (TPR) repeat protein